MAHLRFSRIAIGRLIYQVQKGSRQLCGTNISAFRGHQMRDRDPHPSNHTTANSPRCDPMPPVLAAIFSQQVKEYVKQTSRLQENIKRLWALVWGQCSDTIRTRLQALDTYKDMHAASDGLRLLVAIKDLMYNVQEQKYVPLSNHLAKRQLFLLSQGRNTVGESYEQFKNQTDVLEHVGAGIGDDDAITKQVLRNQGINIEEATEAQ